MVCENILHAAPDTKWPYMHGVNIHAGASVAATLGKGFLAVRKAGHLCVATQNQDYSDYTGKEKTLEVREDVLKPG